MLEWKYDGVRAQIHISRSADVGGGWSDERIAGARVRCLSRHLNDVTVKFRPALEEVVARYVSSHSLASQRSGIHAFRWTGASSCVVDAEIVAVTQTTPGVPVTSPEDVEKKDTIAVAQFTDAEVFFSLICRRAAITTPTHLAIHPAHSTHVSANSRPLVAKYCRSRIYPRSRARHRRVARGCAWCCLTCCSQTVRACSHGHFAAEKPRSSTCPLVLSP